MTKQKTKEAESKSLSRHQHSPAAIQSWLARFLSAIRRVPRGRRWRSGSPHRVGRAGNIRRILERRRGAIIVKEHISHLIYVSQKGILRGLDVRRGWLRSGRSHLGGQDPGKERGRARTAERKTSATNPRQSNMYIYIYNRREETYRGNQQQNRESLLSARHDEPRIQGVAARIAMRTEERKLKSDVDTAQINWASISKHCTLDERNGVFFLLLLGVGVCSFPCTYANGAETVRLLAAVVAVLGWDWLHALGWIQWELCLVIYSYLL